MVRPGTLYNRCTIICKNMRFQDLAVRLLCSAIRAYLVDFPSKVRLGQAAAYALYKSGKTLELESVLGFWFGIQLYSCVCYICQHRSWLSWKCLFYCHILYSVCLWFLLFRKMEKLSVALTWASPSPVDSNFPILLWSPVVRFPNLIPTVPRPWSLLPAFLWRPSKLSDHHQV